MKRILLAGLFFAACAIAMVWLGSANLGPGVAVISPSSVSPAASTPAEAAMAGELVLADRHFPIAAQSESSAPLPTQVRRTSRELRQPFTVPAYAPSLTALIDRALAEGSAADAMDAVEMIRECLDVGPDAKAMRESLAKPSRASVEGRTDLILRFERYERACQALTPAHWQALGPLIQKAVDGVVPRAAEVLYHVRERISQTEPQARQQVFRSAARGDATALQFIGVMGTAWGMSPIDARAHQLAAQQHSKKHPDPSVARSVMWQADTLPDGYQETAENEADAGQRAQEILRRLGGLAPG